MLPHLFLETVSVENLALRSANLVVISLIGIRGQWKTMDYGHLGLTAHRYQYLQIHAAEPTRVFTSIDMPVVDHWTETLESRVQLLGHRDNPTSDRKKRSGQETPCKKCDPL